MKWQDQMRLNLQVPNSRPTLIDYAEKSLQQLPTAPVVQKPKSFHVERWVSTEAPQGQIQPTWTPEGTAHLWPLSKMEGKTKEHR